MLKLSQPITSINGFKIGDRVRLKDGDGRPHIIKSFSIDGMKEFFFEVQFEDGTGTWLDNIAPLPSNLDIMKKEEALKVFRSYKIWDLMDNFTTDELQEMIDAIVSMPSLPSNLDEAADNYAENILANGEDMFDAIADGFKAGAEWMAGQGVKLKCWIARDECSGDESNLYIGQQKPRRIPETAPGFGMWSGYGEFMALPPDMFPELTYSDEPIEVELIINKKYAL